MSKDLIETILKSLKKYSFSVITLTFKNKHQVPLLLVCYLNKCFQLTYLNNQTIETYDDIEPTVLAIEKVVQSELQIAFKSCAI